MPDRCQSTEALACIALAMSIAAVMMLWMAAALYEPPSPLPTPDYRAELEIVAGTMAADIRAATVGAVSGTWEAHVSAIQTEAADEQAEWRRARGLP